MVAMAAPEGTHHPRLVWDGSRFLPPAHHPSSLLLLPPLHHHRGADYRRIQSHPRDELCRFRSSLFWLALDQSTPLRVAVSCIVAFFLALLSPSLCLAIVRCPSCDASSSHHPPFNGVVQISEASLAAISFACLSHNLRKYGLRRFLFLDQITQESFEVQNGYKAELSKAFRLLALILLPSFLVELGHQVWWFSYATVQLPFIHSLVAKNTLMCSIAIVSWLYKTAVFLLPCILFRLMCYLQNLRFEGYIKMLESAPEVSVILREHMHLRQQLNIISHRYRTFIVLSLITITISQFSCLLMITATSGVNFFRAGDLAVCSAVQLTGFVICLHGAARITHRAQRIVSIVSQWHAMSTCQSYDKNIPCVETSNKTSPDCVESEQSLGAESDSDWDAVFNIYSTLNGKMTDDLASFQMRQALVIYLQHNPAGISIFGFFLDRGHLQIIFMIELSLVLWVLGKTVGVPLG